MHHPWRQLREQEHIDVRWLTLPGDLRGMTDGHSTIWMDDRLLQVERRCTLAHEQAHIRLGHVGHQEGREEYRARKLAAQQLIHRDDLIRALQWAMSLEEAADELWVTPEVLRDRIHFMHPSERLLIAAAVEAGKEHHAD